MKFHGFFEGMLGSRVKARLLEYLLKNGGMLSERELAMQVGVSHVAVNSALKEFHDINFITPSKIGGSNVWFINRDSYAYDACGSKLGLGWAAENPPLQDLRTKLEREFNSLREVSEAVIFGSITKGEEESGSDIDLGIIVLNQAGKSKLNPKLEALNIYCLKRYGNKLSPRAYHRDEVNWKGELDKWLREGILIKRAEK